SRPDPVRAAPASPTSRVRLCRAGCPAARGATGAAGRRISRNIQAGMKPAIGKALNEERLPRRMLPGGCCGLCVGLEAKLARDRTSGVPLDVANAFGRHLR